MVACCQGFPDKLRQTRITLSPLPFIHLPPFSLSRSALAKLRDSLACDSLLIHDHFQITVP